MSKLVYVNDGSLEDNGFYFVKGTTDPVYSPASDVSVAAELAAKDAAIVWLKGSVKDAQVNVLQELLDEIDGSVYVECWQYIDQKRAALAEAK